ncbi:MAG: hypothetical protein ACRDM1_03385 [Gaiellaceae bacterium]
MLSVLQEKLGEAHGLAIAATTVTERVSERIADAGLREALLALRREAEEARGRCVAVERLFGDEVATEILARANTTEERSAALVAAWFKAGTGPLAAWSFLSMAEAGEVALWAALVSLAARATGDEGGAVADLAVWALAVEERHLQIALEGVVRLAELTDPAGDRWG